MGHSTVYFIVPINWWQQENYVCFNGWSIVCFYSNGCCYYFLQVQSSDSFLLLPTHDTQIPVLEEEHNFKYIKGNVVCIVFLIFDLFTIENILLTNWYNIFRVFTVDLAVHKPECDVYWYLLTTATYCCPPPLRLTGKKVHLGVFLFYGLYLDRLWGVGFQ